MSYFWYICGLKIGRLFWPRTGGAGREADEALVETDRAVGCHAHDSEQFNYQLTANGLVSSCHDIQGWLVEKQDGSVVAWWGLYRHRALWLFRHDDPFSGFQGKG